MPGRSEGEKTPPPVSSQNIFEHCERCDRSISITQVHIPVAVLATVITATLGLFSTVGFAWFRISEHVGATERHIDVQEAITGGGFATKFEIKDLQGGIEKKTRKLLKSMQISCRQGPDQGSLACAVNLPEE